MKIKFSIAVFILIGFLTSSNSSANVKKIVSKHYSFEVPVFMDEATELNSSASDQYSYIETKDETVLELYLIIIEETHKEIKSYKPRKEFTALSYWEMAVEILVSGISESQIITKDLKIETVNGLDCVQGDIFGEFDDVQIVYRLGVYKGKRAFYQVLTWTIAAQRGRFKQDMEQIVNSFQEK